MRRKQSDSSRITASDSSYASPSSSSSSSSSSSPPDSNASPTNATNQSKDLVTTTKQPLSRRGHFKSRLGCFNCKRRRVKCNELRPSCSPCRRLGLSCVYPTAAPTSSNGPVRANPSILALEDLRFYHQFMTRSFPTLPLRADKVWEQCAAMSHQFECLAHAVLALGASHLTQHGNVDYTPQALHHRVAAIKLVNEQLTNPPEGPAGADALFGAVVCLATQTSLLSDGMAEYLTMTRGGSLIALNIMTDMDKSVFGMFTNEGHIEAVSSIVSPQQADFTLAAEFLKSLEQLQPLCKESYEIVYYNALAQCIVGLENSAFQAWAEFAGLFRLHAFFSHEDFQVFVNPENYVCQLLIIHMFLLDYVLGQYCISASEEFKFPARRWVIISWARDLVKRLPRDYKKYGVWIESYCDVLAEGDGRYLLTP